jgi:hypothetical protein
VLGFAGKDGVVREEKMCLKTLTASQFEVTQPDTLAPAQTMHTKTFSMYKQRAVKV